MAEIDIRKVEKSYGRTKVVHGIDLNIFKGEFVVILGPSGCGKSTLLRMIAGLEKISGGEISIGGTVVNTLEPRDRGCAMVFQNYALYPHMSVADNIGYALKVQGIGKQERLDRITHLIADSIGTEVCSIYLFRDSETLELCATEGLKREAVHKTRMKLGEGLVGRVARTATPVNTGNAPAECARSQIASAPIAWARAVIAAMSCLRPVR